MKKLLISLLVVISLSFASSALADKENIICPCGCKQPATVCGCPIALEALKGK